MANWYVKAGTVFDDPSCKFYVYLNLTGYDEDDYETQDDSDISAEDPFLKLGGAGGVKEVQIGLDSHYRIRITNTGIEAWDEGSSAWVDLIGGGIAGNVFKVIDVPAGTNPVADGPVDTLTLTSGNNILTITGDETTDTIDFVVVEGNIIHDNIGGLTSDNHHAQAHAATHKTGGADVVTLEAPQVEIDKLGATSYDDLEDWVNVTQSSGHISGGEITDDLDGTITVAAGEGMIKIADSDLAGTIFFVWAQNAALVLSDVDINYIYVDYNGGAPIVKTTNDRDDIELNRMFTLGRVWKNGNTIHILELGVHIHNFIRRSHERVIKTHNYQRVSGGVVSEEAVLKLSTTEGIFYLGLNEVTTVAQDTTGVDRFTYWYMSAVPGVWTSVGAQAAIDNTHYDDGDGILGNLSPNKYGVHWVFIHYDSDIHVVYGVGDYKLSEALNAGLPAELPIAVTEFAILSAKIIIKVNGASFTSIVSTYTTPFPINQPLEHNDLGAIQGGAADDYYHLTNAQEGTLTSAGDADALHTHDLKLDVASKYTNAEAVVAVEAAGLDFASTKTLGFVDDVGGVFVDRIYDENDLASDDEHGLATQQSIKAAIAAAAGADANAIHVNAGAEISGIANKAAPVGADYLVIEDSEDGDDKKHITIGDLPGGGITVTEDAGAPTITPDAVGDVYINTDNLAVYMAAATAGPYSFALIGKAQSSAFVFDTIVGLQVWLDAALGITKDGADLVAQWNDQSGNGHNCTATNKPLWVDNQINSLPSVRFDGVNDYMISAAFVLNQPVTIFFVLKVISNTGQDMWGIGRGARVEFSEEAPNPNEATIYAGTAQVGSTAFNDTTWYLWTGIFNGVNSSLRKNADAKNSGNAGGNNLTGYYLGRSTIASYSNIEIAEMLIYDSTLSDANELIVRTYLNNKYGIY